MPRPMPRPQQLTTDVDMRGLKPMNPAFQVPMALPPLELQPLKSPFFISSLPTTAAVNPDSIRNFNTHGIPQYRITPPVPINAASGATNVTVPVKTVPKLLQPTPAPTISQQLTTIPTGYQFSFLQVRLPLQDTVAISSYKIYRSTANNSASASVIQSVIHHQANVGIPVIIQDSQPNGVTQFYWVSAINNGGQESSLVPAQSASVKSNAGFSATSQLASSFHGLPVNTSFSSFDSTTLSNDGVGNSISIASNSLTFAAGVVSYNSGTALASGFGDFYVYADDLNFQGGAVPYTATSASESLVLNEGRLPFGKIHTSTTGSSTGGGFSGGTTTGLTVTGAAGRGIVQS